MYPDKTVSEIMLSLSEYAVVDESASLYDALLALEKAQSLIPEGKQPHRAVLVQKSDGTFIGKVGHLSFLRALLPDQEMHDSDELLERAGVTDEMKHASQNIYCLFNNNILDVCERAHYIKIADVCTQNIAFIESDCSLVDAIKRFVDKKALSLLVTRNNKPIGILRLSDLFDEIAHLVCSCECDSYNQ